MILRASRREKLFVDLGRKHRAFPKYAVRHRSAAKLRLWRPSNENCHSDSGIRFPSTAT